MNTLSSPTHRALAFKKQRRHSMNTSFRHVEPGAGSANGRSAVKRSNSVNLRRYSGGLASSPLNVRRFSNHSRRISSGSVSLQSDLSFTRRVSRMSQESLSSLGGSDVDGGGASTPNSHSLDANAKIKQNNTKDNIPSIRKLNRQLSLQLKEKLGKIDPVLRGEHFFSRPSAGGAVSCSSKYVMHPHSLFRIAWLVLIWAALLTTLIVAPLNYGFNDEAESSTCSSCFFIRTQQHVRVGMLDAFFVANVVVNFMTGYISGTGTFVTNLGDIATHYFTNRYLLLDLVCATPALLLAVLFGESANVNTLAAQFVMIKLIKFAYVESPAPLLRFSRWPRLRKIGQLLEDAWHFHANTMSLLRTFVVGLAWIHVTACSFASVGRISAEREGRSWLIEDGSLDGSTWERYVSSMYWAITTMATVGFGDIVPQTTSERVFSFVTVGLGVVFYAVMLSEFMSIAASRSQHRKRSNERMSSIATYMRSKAFPPSLFKKVFKYYLHYYERKTAFDEAQILGELSEKLRAEVSSYMAFSTFSGADLFHKYDVKYLTLLLLITKPLRLQQDEVIFEAGQVGMELFMITAGKVTVAYKTRQSKGRTLERGDTFGELCTLGLAERRQETVAAIEITELLSVSKFDLFNTLGESAPHVLADMRRSIIRKYSSLYRHKSRRVSFVSQVMESASSAFSSAAMSGGGQVHPARTDSDGYESDMTEKSITTDDEVLDFHDGDNGYGRHGHGTDGGGGRDDDSKKERRHSMGSPKMLYSKQRRKSASAFVPTTPPMRRLSRRPSRSNSLAELQLIPEVKNDASTGEAPRGFLGHIAPNKSSDSSFSGSPSSSKALMSSVNMAGSTLSRLPSFHGDGSGIGGGANSFSTHGSAANTPRDDTHVQTSTTHGEEHHPLAFSPSVQSTLRSLVQRMDRMEMTAPRPTNAGNDGEVVSALHDEMRTLRYDVAELCKIISSSGLVRGGGGGGGGNGRA